MRILDGANLPAMLDHAVDLHQAGRLEEAKAAYLEILRVSPDIPEVRNNLACIYLSQGNFQQAVSNCHAALQSRPDYAEAWNNLGNAYKNLRDFRAAVECYTKSLALKADNPAACNNLGVTLRKLGEFDAAAKNFEHAIVLKPDYVEAYVNLGISLKEQGRLEEAASPLLTALQLEPHNPNTLLSLGNLMAAAGKLDEALQLYDAAMLVQPDFAEAEWNAALAYLSKGELEKGWKGHELRFKFQNAYPFHYAKPLWQGEPFQDKRLLIYDEIGYGDVFQFIRYLPMVKERGGSLLFECKPGLRRLLQGFPDVDELLERGDRPVPEHLFDLHLPLESLPRIFATTLQTVPDNVPYLKADPQLVAHWANRLKSLGGLKVGLVWAGNPDSQYDAARSATLHDLAPLASLRDVSLVSLQKGSAELALAHLPEGFAITSLGCELQDFADTAAVIENLDLVIAVETAVPHLAGAMGKPVWVMLSTMPAWRWMLERNDSPWYPSMRLFRQKQHGEWCAPVQEMLALLGQMVNA